MRHDTQSGWVRVWDPVVRLFHWSLAGIVLANLFILEDGKLAHRYAGYAAAALVLLRIVWGFAGSHYARFVHFLPTPRRVRDHLGTLIRREPDPHLGHNPLGGIVMLAMMSLVLTLGVTGFMMGMDAFWGEEWLESLHGMIADVLIGLVGLHVLAAIGMSLWTRQNLVRAMVTGRKRDRAPENALTRSGK